jgi:histidine decarboxylase
VVLRTPPQAVRDKWVLADDGQWSHIVCVPGVTAAQIDEFVADLWAAISRRRRRRNAPPVYRPNRSRQESSPSTSTSQ